MGKRCVARALTEVLGYFCNAKEVSKVLRIAEQLLEVGNTLVSVGWWSDRPCRPVRTSAADMDNVPGDLVTWPFRRNIRVPSRHVYTFDDTTQCQSGSFYTILD